MLRWARSRRRPAPLAAATRRAAVRRRSSAHDGPGGLAGRAASTRRSPRPTCAARGRSAGGRRRRSRSRSGASCGAGERFVYAYYDGIDKTAHERGFGDVLRRRAARRRPPRRRRPRRAPARRGAARHRRPRPGRGRRPHRRARPATCSTWCAHAVGRGPLPLAARPPRRGRRAARRRRPTRYGDVAWVVTREQIVDERLVRARRSPRRSPPASATWRSSPSTPISFVDPADTGPFELVCRHGSLTSAEMLVPLLARAAR